MSTMLRVAGVASSLAAAASAHGITHGLLYNGEWIQGYLQNYQYMNPEPDSVGWRIPEDQDNGFIAPNAFADADVICHKGAMNAQLHAEVTAGDELTFSWTEWPESHKGPMITYLASCGGDSCADVDKSGLEFFKIDEAGYTDGTWASDTMIANNNSWTVTIPSSIKAGAYVARHETIALHSAGQADGAQAYPFCLNLKIASDGTDEPSGTLGTALMTAEDPGIVINIYGEMGSYEIPGPPLYDGASSSSGANSGSNSSSSSDSPASDSPAAPSSPDAPSSPSSATAPAATSAAPAATTSAPAAADESGEEDCEEDGAYDEPATSADAGAASPTSATPEATSAPDYGAEEDCEEDTADDAAATGVAAADVTSTAEYPSQPTSKSVPEPSSQPASSSAPAPSPTKSYGGGAGTESKLAPAVTPSAPSEALVATEDDAAPGTWNELNTWLKWLSNTGSSLFSSDSGAKARRHARQF